MMEQIEEKVKQVLQLELAMLVHDSKFRFIYDWNDVRQVVESLIPTVFRLVNQEREERRKLEARLNMLSFRSNPERDDKIIQLRKNGMSLRKISREIFMSPEGVRKALIRLGVDSVDKNEESQKNTAYVP